MSDEPSASVGVSAGRLLREARQAQGLHIAALANAIKVAPRKLEALEGDRFQELPDATFTRALAQTVCRTLKIEAAPVLALLPPAGGQGLGHLGEGLNTPFREGIGQPSDGDRSMLARPAVWAPIVVLLIAALVYLAPASWFELGPSRSQARVDASTTTASTSVPAADRAVGRVEAPPSTTSAPASKAASMGHATDRPGSAGDGMAGSAQIDASAAVPSVVGAPSQQGSAVPAAFSMAPASAAVNDALVKPLQVLAVRDSWIEVLDASGQALLSRTLKAGETVELEGALPLRVRIGNAAYTEVTFRGQALPLAPYTRNNLARLELK